MKYHAPVRLGATWAVRALTLSALLLVSGCTSFFKYGTVQPFGGGQSKIVPVSMYDPRAADPKKRIAAWAYYDAKYRASHIVTDKDGNPIILSEAPPDVATSIERLLSLNAKLKGQDTLTFSNSLRTAVEKLGERTATVELMRDGGYLIRELAFNNLLQGPQTNVVATTASNGTTNTTVTTTSGPAAVDQQLQRLFSLIQAVETSQPDEQAERAKSVSLYLQSCLSSGQPMDSNVITLLQEGGRIHPQTKPANPQ